MAISVYLSLSEPAGSGEQNPQRFSGRYSFHQQEVVVGRSEGADLCLPHPAVSLTHLVLRQDPGCGDGEEDRVTVEDRGSTNGTHLADRRLPARHRTSLPPGAALRVGPFTLVLEGTPPAPARGAQEPVPALQDRGELARITRSVMEFSGQSGDSAPRALLEVVQGPDRGRRLRLPRGEGTRVVGRSARADLPLSDPDTSRRHVELRCHGDRVEIRDLGSKNGLTLDGRPVEGWSPLADGTRLGLGQTELLFRDPAGVYLQSLQLEIPGGYDEDAPSPRAAWERPLTVAVGLVVLAAAAGLIYLLVW